MKKGRESRPRLFNRLLIMPSLVFFSFKTGTMMGPYPTPGDRWQAWLFCNDSALHTQKKTLNCRHCHQAHPRVSNQICFSEMKHI